MKASRWHVAVLVFGSLIFFGLQESRAAEFVLTSPQVQDGRTPAPEQVLNGFGCTGQNISPALHWANPPENTKSFAVTLYDPDAPTGSGWWHWVVFNIPAESRELVGGAGESTGGLSPAGSVQSMTDFGKPGYGGPCPPAGDKPHRYVFTVYALDIDKIPLEPSAPAAMVGFYLHQHALDRAGFTFLYSR